MKGVEEITELHLFAKIFLINSILRLNYDFTHKIDINFSDIFNKSSDSTFCNLKL
ncbi:hypothetical protein J2T04_003908 [Chryseobacterium lathyri]|uniref:Uncharacterized protein n=1 Tax=Chryseobacterium lathyri TaxID=395933 RepID=A0ABT9SU59_9FLAO|nr:hypothetical protein [Chryseobacterium lathyri]